MLDAIGLALSLLLGASDGPRGVLPADMLPTGMRSWTPPALDRSFHPRERAVGDWRWEAAASLDAPPGVRAAILLGRDPAAVSRCVKLNNYWCIKRGGWSGEIAADAEGHVAFASTAEGAAVAALLLRRYYVDYGRRSALAIVSRWAPASCGGALPRVGSRVASRIAPRGAPTASTAPTGLARRGLGGTLRARWLAAHGRRVAGFGRPRGRASSVPDPLIGAALPAPAIALGLGAAPAGVAASLPDLLPRALAGGPSPPPPSSSAPGPACAGEAVRIRNYAARAAAGIAAPEADLGLFDAAGRPTPHLARVMRNMASVEIGPLGADAGLVEAAVARAAAMVAARRPPAPAATPGTAPHAAPRAAPGAAPGAGAEAADSGAPTPARLDEAGPPHP